MGAQLVDPNTAAKINNPAVSALVSFSDEFSYGAALSYYDAEHAPGGKWGTHYNYQGEDGVGSYTLVSNNELQIYTSPYFRRHPGDFNEVPFVSNSDGTLSIWTRPSTNPEIFGYRYTSGMLNTKYTHAQTYGYFEMRADVPSADGAWPAFWLLPTSGWPPEVDVMEVLSRQSGVTYVTKHSGLGGHTSQGIPVYTPGDGMHTYGVLWTKSVLAWYIDDKLVYSTATPADMHQPMFLIANVALGGWGGSVNNAELPAQMKIDYIRAFNLPADGGHPLSLEAPPPTGQRIVGTKRGEALQGTTGSDTLDGGQGNDTITGGRGDDFLYGGAGDDRFVFVKGAMGHDTVEDFAPGTKNDTLVFVGFNGERPIIVQTASGALVTFASTGESVLLLYDQAQSLQTADWMTGTSADPATWAYTSVKPSAWVVDAS